MNNKTLILVGKTASGKSTTAKILETAGYRRIVTDTTRPMREGEINGIDYNFRTPEEFLCLKYSGYYAETVTYNASFGICSYGSSKASYETENKSVIVLNPYGLKMVKNSIKPGSSISVYLHASDETLVERLHLRGDQEKEIERRLEHDAEDFADMPVLCDYIVHVQKEDTPEQIAARVLDVINQGEKGINLAFCVDDHMGMMFNRRRLSQDSILRERLLKMASDLGGYLVVTPYTAKQFKEGGKIKVQDEPWKNASSDDLVFVEEIDPAMIDCNLRTVTMYNWNRHYPSDLKCTYNFDSMVISNSRDFVGSSHQITEEIYTR